MPKHFCDLKNNFTVNQWLDMVNIREETVNSYLSGMQTFTEFTNKTPEQLLNGEDAKQKFSVKAKNRYRDKNLKGSGIIVLPFHSFSMDVK